MNERERELIVLFEILYIILLYIHRVSFSYFFKTIELLLNTDKRKRFSNLVEPTTAGYY